MLSGKLYMYIGGETQIAITLNQNLSAIMDYDIFVL